MCIVINPDIIVGAEISEFWSYLNLVEKDPIEKIRKMSTFYLSVKDCMSRQDLSTRMGLGNVVAVSGESDYRKFLEQCGLFVWAENDQYQIKQECVTLLPQPESIKNDVSDVTQILKRIVKTIYKQRLLEAFHIV